MQRLVFWLAYPLLWLISILPFPLFYLVSDFTCFIVYRIIGYRRKTVRNNLKLVFPEKSTAEIKKIEKKFYRHMVDMFLEMIKTMNISDKELKKRFRFTNVEELEKISARDQSLLLACGHYASYEWIIALQLYGLDFDSFGIYKTVKNKFFDKLVRDIRGRYDAQLIPSHIATKSITNNQEQGLKAMYGMIADQSPKKEKARNWTKFMGIRVPVFIGTEHLARKLNMAVVYLKVEKVKRGHYEATFIPITYNPLEEEEYSITKRYFKELEEQIYRAPEYYLWTHKRWKHRNAPIPPNGVEF